MDIGEGCIFGLGDGGPWSKLCVHVLLARRQMQLGGSSPDQVLGLRGYTYLMTQIQ